MNLAELARRSARAVAEAIARGMASRRKQPLPVHPEQRSGPPPVIQPIPPLPPRPPLPQRNPALEELQRMMHIVESGIATGSKADQVVRQLAPLLRGLQTSRGLTQSQQRIVGDIAAALDTWATKKQRQSEAPRRGAEEGWPEETDIATEASWEDFNRPNRMIQTPGSSNVHSFIWVEDEHWSSLGTAGLRHKRRGPDDMGTLVVTYKEWHPGSTERPHSPGATYAYSDVPRAKWESFENATDPNSAGIAVWDYLRLRGTQYGHQHPYRLVTTAGNYIPRKINASGYTRWQLPHIKPWGEVQWRRSTLPLGPRVELGPEIDYATARTLAPRRNAAAAERRNGAPNRGTPNNGRR